MSLNGQFMMSPDTIGSLEIPLRPADRRPPTSAGSEPGRPIAPITSMTFVSEPATASRFAVVASIAWMAVPADSLV